MGFKVLLRATPGEFRSKLASVFDEQSFTLVAPDDVNWSNKSEASLTVEASSPSIFVNFFNNNDDSEVEALKNISELCQENNMSLIHFSSYRVFGRTVNEKDLAEDTIPSPRDFNGKRLLELEKYAAERKKHIILRLSWVLGGEHENLLHALIPRLISGEPLFVSDHHFGRPVNIDFLCNVVLALTQQLLCGSQNWGVFHLHGSDKCSEAEFCDVLVRMLNAELKRDLAMPMVAGVDDDRRLLSGNAMLAGSRCTDNFGIQLKSWRNGFKTLVKNYLSENAFTTN